MTLNVERQANAIVRGGFTASEVVLDAKIRLRLRTMRMWSPRERAEYAALLAFGFVSTHTVTEQEPVIWHRLIGSSAVSVGTI